MSDDRRGLAELDSMDARILFALLALFVLSRLLWLHENPMSVDYFEESYRWISAHEILTDPVQPLLEYQADHYQGGSLVMIALVMAVFLLLGESLFTFKLAALLVSTATLAMLYVLGARTFGRRTGLLAALAYLTGPPLVAFWGLNVMGSHSESILISLVTLLLFFEIRAGRLRTPVGWGLFGFVAGFGTWFCYTSGLPLIACALTWLMLEAMPRPREILSAALGVVVGLLPWFAYNLRHDFAGFTRILELFGGGNPVDPWLAQTPLEKIVAMVTHDFPVGLLGPIPGVLPEFIGPVLFVCGTVPLAVALGWTSYRVAALLRDATGDREERRRELVFIVYGLVFLAVFLASRFTVNTPDGIVSYRLFIPPAVLLLLPAANAAARALTRGGLVRAVAATGCALCLLSFATATTFLATDAKAGAGRAQLFRRGYVIRGLLLHRKFEHEIEQALEAGRLIRTSQHRANVLSGIGWGLEFRFEQDASLEPIEHTLAALSGKERTRVLSGMLWSARTRIRQLGEREGTEREVPGDLVVRERLAQLETFAQARLADPRAIRRSPDRSE